MNLHKYNHESGFCQIKAFDLNTKASCRKGFPPFNPADSYLISTFAQDIRTNILLDAGKKGHGAHIIIPYLVENRIDTLDRVILSHLHFDHFGGIIDLINDNRITIRELIYSPLPDIAMKNGDAGELNEQLWKELEALLRDSGQFLTEITTERTGDTIDIGGEASLDIVSVPEELVLNEDGRTNLNEMNLIVKLNYKEFSALFPGDCGPRQAERILHSNQVHKLKDIFMLKAAHHGGDESTSEAFIKLCNPRIVVIPCNEEVTLHRPSFIENYHLLGGNGAKLFRCDFYHGIEIVTDGVTAQCFGNTGVYTEQVSFSGLEHSLPVLIQ